eukprot:TRINITY_DN23876_c0_g1_i1.p1 TRINITY_DN23876_c0_g1~~TRINITY_DN23876_c0_g1_i1.p1  ORF type:complete len:189 (-),score=69.60 TRINITY_DN23876_c0_g1_i1:27-572(-)
MAQQQKRSVEGRPALNREDALLLTETQAPLHPSQKTKDDTKVCPSLGNDESSSTREEERLHKEMVKGVTEKPKVIIEGEITDPNQKKSAELTREEKLRKMEERKRAHEAKLLAEEGELPAWMEKHKKKEELGTHLGAKTVEIHYVSDGKPHVRDNLPPALLSSTPGVLSDIKNRHDRTDNK